MHRRHLAAVLAAGAIALGAAGSALAVTPPGTLDQKHECGAAPANCNLSGEVVYPKWYSEVNPPVVGATVALAQTFKPSTSGPLAAVELYVQYTELASPAPLKVSILKTVGGIPQMQTPLATTTVDTQAAGASTSPSWILVTFSTPATLTAGTLYAIALGNGDQSTPWLQWQADASWAGTYTDYANGEAMVGTHATAAPNNDWYDLFQITSLSDGQSGNADYAFRTYMGAAGPAPTPTATAAPTTAATPTATPFVPTQPPTDAAPAGQGGSGSSGVLPVVLALGGLAAVALLAPRRRGAARRR